MSRSAALAVALALATGLGAVTPVTAQTDRPELREIVFVGNTVFSDDSLEVAIVNRDTGCRAAFAVPLCWAGWDAFIDRQYLVPRQIALDALRLEQYYAYRGYREAKVDTALVELDEGVRLEFTIEEGQPTLIDSLSFIGLEEIQRERRERLVADLPVAVGDLASVIAIDRARDLIISRLLNVGYAHAEVLTNQFRPEGSRTESVEFIFDTGPEVRIGEIRVEGNRYLDETSVRRMVPFERGDVYRRRELVEGQRNLYAVELIRVANDREEGERLDTVLPILLDVQEGDLHRVRTALGWSTSDCINVEAEWSSRNWFGGARRLSVGARVSNILAPQLNRNACPQTGTGEFAELNGQVEVELVQPWIFSPRNSLGLSAFVERQSLQDVFIREALGVNVSLSRLLTPWATATLSYEPQITRLDAAEIFFCSSFLACTEDDIALFRASNWLSPLGLSFNLDRSNQILNPTQGWQANIALETASNLTGSDFAYRRATAVATGYEDFDVGVLALRLAGGIVSEGEFFRLVEAEDRVGIINPEKRLYSGGASSVRGYAENRLGPRVLSVPAIRLIETPGDGSAACTPQEVFDATCDAAEVRQGAFLERPTGGNRLLEANLEFRLPLGGDRFQFVSFVDAGQVWDVDEELDLSDIAVTPGIGFRYFSPVGPIRVDLGLRPTDDRELRVISSGIRPFDPADDDPADRLEVRGPGGVIAPIDWVRTADLIFLDPRIPFAQDGGFLSRLQLHISIGQAF